MKSILGNFDIAVQYFEEFIPVHLKEIFDLSTIEHAPKNFVSDRFKEPMADIVFKCSLK